MAMASMMTNRKMLARLTITSAMPARLTGLRSSMRERCQGSTAGGGVFSVSMFNPCGFRFFLGAGFSQGGFAGRLGDPCCSVPSSVPTMLLTAVVQRHFPVPPCPVHRIHVWIEERLIEMPDRNGERRQHRFVEVNRSRDIE